MWLTGLADTLREAGVKVVEVNGWKTRGHGGMTDVKGVTCHHTASGRSKTPKLGLTTVTNGRPGLEGPLAHLYLDRDGTWYVVAAGLCYHAGVSRQTDMTNSHRIGIEANAAGDGWDEDWPAIQMVSYAIGCRALSKRYGFGVSEILGHKETCSPVGRKIDPSFNMGDFRDLVRSAELNDLEDDLNLEDKVELSPKAQELMGEKSQPVRMLLQWAPGVRAHRNETAEGFKKLTALIGAQNATITALAAAIKDGGSLTPAQAEAAAAAGARAALAELADRLDG